MDVICALILLVLTSPFFLITAILVKLYDHGPVFYKQVRCTMNQQEFRIIKFRSMKVNADADKLQATKDDPRKTRWGDIMRKTNIDEMPQFWNVLKGDMSLVGTRPPTLDEVEKYERKQWRRISIKPGITGMWQVNGRSKIDNFDDIVEMDVEYIDNWSLMSDIKIILKTFIVLLKHDDAY